MIDMLPLLLSTSHWRECCHETQTIHHEYNTGYCDYRLIATTYSINQAKTMLQNAINKSINNKERIGENHINMIVEHAIPKTIKIQDVVLQNTGFYNIKDE